MAGTIKFDLVSPERRLASLEATEVRVPGAEGDMTAMAGHVPTVTTLRPGVLLVTHAGGTDEYVVVGGFADISGEAVTVLAERSMHREEMTQEVVDDLVAEAREAHEKAKASDDVPHDVAEASAKFLSDLVAMGDHINLPPSSRVPAP